MGVHIRMQGRVGKWQGEHEWSLHMHTYIQIFRGLRGKGRKKKVRVPWGYCKSHYTVHIYMHAYKHAYIYAGVVGKKAKKTDEGAGIMWVRMLDIMKASSKLIKRMDKESNGFLVMTLRMCTRASTRQIHSMAEVCMCVSVCVCVCVYVCVCVCVCLWHVYVCMCVCVFVRTKKSWRQMFVI